MNRRMEEQPTPPLSTALEGGRLAPLEWGSTAGRYVEASTEALQARNAGLHSHAQVRNG